MKTRTISAVVMFIILVPLIILGGSYFYVGLYIVSIFALKEFLDIKSSKKEIPSPIRLLSYIFMTLLVLVGIKSNTDIYALDYKLLAALVMLFLIPTVLYHDRKKYSINDAFYLIGGLLFLGISLSLFIIVRDMGLKIFVFLVSIPIITDVFAYVTGLLIGKHKLLPKVSPKKTWEGFFGGILFSVFACSMFYITCINPEINKLTLILICIFLSIIGQIGDLVFSMIKRYYNKKDFSKLIPGHGGVLDRLDSMIFVMLGFMFFIGII